MNKNENLIKVDLKSRNSRDRRRDIDSCRRMKINEIENRYLIRYLYQDNLNMWISLCFYLFFIHSLNDVESYNDDDYYYYHDMDSKDGNQIKGLKYLPTTRWLTSTKRRSWYITTY